MRVPAMTVIVPGGATRVCSPVIMTRQGNSCETALIYIDDDLLYCQPLRYSWLSCFLRYWPRVRDNTSTWRRPGWLRHNINLTVEVLKRQSLGIWLFVEEYGRCNFLAIFLINSTTTGLQWVLVMIRWNTLTYSYFVFISVINRFGIDGIMSSNRDVRDEPCKTVYITRLPAFVHYRRR